MQLKLDIESLESQKKKFASNGFVIFKSLIPDALVELVRRESLEVMSGIYSTSIIPDKIKRQELGTGNHVLHSICNAWKANAIIRDFVLRPEFGLIANEFMNWQTTKLNQDTIYLIPPGGGPTSMHQDNPYQDWHSSKNGVITAWMPLNAIDLLCSPLEYIACSHKLKNSGMRLNSNFIGERDYLNEFKLQFPEFDLSDKNLVKLDLRPGDVAFHHGDLWHGSQINKSKKDRHALSIHLMDGRAQFIPENPSPFFSRYKLDDSCVMNDSFFPTYK